jgi:hypothetical protein
MWDKCRYWCYALSMSINDIPSAIETLMAETMAKISRTAGGPNCDVAELEALTKRASELKQMTEQVAAIQHRLASMSARGENMTDDGTTGIFRRKLLIEVSQGMINQNLLLLTEPLKRGLVKTGEELTIEPLPKGDRFKSAVIQPGNRLQERGAIGKFYRDAMVNAGDYVILGEVAPGQWQLRKR